VSGGIVRVALIATSLAVVVSGCSQTDDTASPLSGSSGRSPAGTPTSSAGSTPPGSGLPATEVTMRPAGSASEADRAVLEGYRRFWQSLATAYTTGDVTALRAATTDPATGRYVKVAADLRRQGRTLQGPVSLAPLVVGRSGTVTLAECADLRKFRTYDGSGRALFPEDEGLTTAEVRLRNIGGTWRVASFEQRPSGCRRQGG
jgi:hypothetical protein